MGDEVFALERFPVHLGGVGAAETLPAFDGSGEWYMRYAQAHAADGRNGRLVSMFTFTESWPSWEVHPHGHELVVCTAGTMTLHQEIDGNVRTVTLHAGDAVINPPGAWHTADIEGTATALFITAGEGTENRVR